MTETKADQAPDLAGPSPLANWRPGASHPSRKLTNQDDHGCETAGGGDRPRGARFGAKAGWLRQPPCGAHPWVAAQVPAASLRGGGGVPPGCRAQALRFIESAGPGIKSSVQLGRKMSPITGRIPGERPAGLPAGGGKAEPTSINLARYAARRPSSLDAAPVSAADQVERAFSDSKRRCARIAGQGMRRGLSFQALGRCLVA